MGGCQTCDGAACGKCKEGHYGIRDFLLILGGGRPEVLLCEHFTLREMCQSLNLVHIGLSGG